MFGLMKQFQSIKEMILPIGMILLNLRAKELKDWRLLKPNISKNFCVMNLETMLFMQLRTLIKQEKKHITISYRGSSFEIEISSMALNNDRDYSPWVEDSNSCGYRKLSIKQS